MATPTKDSAFNALKKRGFIKQSTGEEEIKNLLETNSITAYVGIDPTADSLHVGHLLPLMAMMHLSRHGHRPIGLLGGGTARVGDPSGKTEMRKMLSAEQIQSNVQAIDLQVRALLKSEKTVIANNFDWLGQLNYIEFLRDIGRHFSVNKMLSAEAYKVRLERGLSFIEFNYQLLQAYDFLELYRRHQCVLQIGGDDQWSNILAGTDLVRRKEQAEVYGLTFPLLLTATGEKMGKTAGGAVWLSKERLPVFDYYQYWVNVHDDDVEKLLRFFTFLPVDEIAEIQNLDGAAKNAAKNILAFEATLIVHGETAAHQAHQAALSAFGNRSIPDAILPSSTVARKVEAATGGVPSEKLRAAEVDAGLSILDLLVRTNLCKSKSEARRKIKEGAVKLAETKIQDEQFVLTPKTFATPVLELRLGKKRLCLLEIEN